RTRGERLPLAAGRLAVDELTTSPGGGVLLRRPHQRCAETYVRRATKMNLLNIVTSPRKEKSASTAIVNAFLSEFREHVRDVTVDRLDIWQDGLPEFGAEAI